VRLGIHFAVGVTDIVVAVGRVVVCVDMADWVLIFEVVHYVSTVAVDVVRAMDCSQQAEVDYAAVDVENTTVEVSCCRPEVECVVVAVIAAAMEIVVALAVAAGMVLLDGFGVGCQSSIQQRPYWRSSFRCR
jgi:hypothetical protein